MSDRKQTPDILSELLSGARKKQEAPPPPEARAAPPPPERRAEPSRAVEGEGEEPTYDKVKATYYLSPAAVEAVDDLWYQLRRQTMPERRTSISKSLIVDLVVQLALEELQRDGRDSALARRLGL